MILSIRGVPVTDAAYHERIVGKTVTEVGPIRTWPPRMNRSNPEQGLGMVQDIGAEILCRRLKLSISTSTMQR